MPFKPFTILLLLLAPFISFSQKSIETYYDYNWHETFADHARFYSIARNTDSDWYKQVFYINLKKLQMVGLFEDKETTIRNGTFYWVYPDNKFKTIGRYVHNKKEGLWLDYYSDGSLEDSTVYHDDHPIGVSLSWYQNGFAKDSMNMNENGNGVFVSWFDNGLPSSAGRIIDFNKHHGQWQYFHKNGKVSAIEVYDQDTLKAKQNFDESGNQTDTTNRDREARFPGGEKAWSKYLSGQLKFPSNMELLNSEQAVVVVSATINEEGKVIAAEVTVPFHPVFDEIALNAVKKSPPWLPAIEHNRKVYYHLTEAVTFEQSFQ
jgi:hypothetical protein